MAPGFGALAVAVAASRSGSEHRTFRFVLAVALGLTAFGQLIATIPDAFPGTAVPLLQVVSQACNLIGASLGIAALSRTLYGRLDGEARRQALLDGLIIMAASVTFFGADSLRSAAEAGAQVGVIFAGSPINLLVPVASAIFVSMAGAAAVSALALRVEPGWRGVWAVVAGIVLIDVAWNLNKRIDPDSTTPEIETILSRIRPRIYGAKLLGAGGGGFLLIVAKTPKDALAIRRALTSDPPNARARFFDFQISSQGLTVTVC